MSVPKFNLWQCKVLFALTPMDLVRVSEQAQVDIKLLNDTANREGWHRLKERYNALSNENQQDVDVIDLLLDAPLASNKQFISDVLKKVEQSKKEKSKESLRSQYANQISEFGMSLTEAEKLLSEYDRNSSGAAPGNFEVNSTMTDQEKLDVINAGYKYVAQGLNGGVEECHSNLRKAIDFWMRMINDLSSKYPQGATFKELAQLQRPLSYAAQSLAKLTAEYAALSGVNGYVNHHAAVAKLGQNGYHVVHKDILGKISRA